MDHVIETLRAMQPDADGRATPEEVAMFCRLFGLEPPADDKGIPPPSVEERSRLRIWLEDREQLSERERVEFMRAYHRSAAWRTVVEELSRELGLR